MKRRLLQYVALLVLFAVSFFALDLVFGYVIDLQSETNDCFFMFGRQFALEFMDHPAAPLTYTGRFLGQCYHYRWLGALIVSAGITCFGVLFYGVLRKLQDTAGVSRAILPCLLLLALHTSTVCLIQDTLGLCGSCGAFWGYLCLRRKPARRIYAFLGIPLGYLVLGGYVWLFVAWVVVFECLDGPLLSGLVFKIGYVLLSVAVPLAAWRWVFPIPLRNAIVWPLMFAMPFRSGVPHCSSANLALDCLLALLFFTSVLSIPFWDRLSLGGRFSAFLQHKWKRLVTAAVLAAVVVLCSVIRYDAALASRVGCHQAYKHKQWDLLLEKARQCPRPSLEVQFMTNFALSQKGRLLEEMFHYPQDWGTRGLILTFSNKSWGNPAGNDIPRAMYNSDLFYEMGHVNLAFMHAFDSMTAIGETYAILRRMVQCSVANGNHEMADKYLRKLERTLFHQDFARRYRAVIADLEAADKEFGQTGKRLPRVDIPIREDTLRHVTSMIDGDNPMAFNYRTAWLLLDKRKSSLATICENVEQFEGAGYVSIPAHCQEVLWVWEREERTPVDLRGFEYDPAITSRADQFLNEISGLQDLSKIVPYLEQKYGDTYMYYCYCVATPDEIRRLLSTSGDFAATSREE